MFKYHLVGQDFQAISCSSKKLVYFFPPWLMGENYSEKMILGNVFSPCTISTLETKRQEKVISPV